MCEQPLANLPQLLKRHARSEQRNRAQADHVAKRIDATEGAPPEIVICKRRRKKAGLVPIHELPLGQPGERADLLGCEGQELRMGARGCHSRNCIPCRAHLCKWERTARTDDRLTSSPDTGVTYER